MNTNAAEPTAWRARKCTAIKQGMAATTRPREEAGWVTMGEAEEQEEELEAVMAVQETAAAVRTAESVTAAVAATSS
jgi:hypothetical protein